MGEAARELIVLEACGQGRVSSGKAAELLEHATVSLLSSMLRALGIPFFDMTDEEWRGEVERARKL